jgi:hypothetical protein
MISLTRWTEALGLWVWLLPLLAIALDFPEHIDEFKPRDVMWQALPEQVRTVFVGPDDRVWQQMKHPAQKENLETARKIIKREFSKPAPQLFGVRPALFEPKGRVWFVTHSQTTILGYDGKDLIEKKAEDKHFFPGNCPNHGRVHRTAYNLVVVDTAFFLESHGVLTFAKGEWSYLQMAQSSPVKRRATYPSLYAEPDGKGVTALLIDGDKTCLWRWRNGIWTQVTLPDAIVSNTITAAAPWLNGIWLFTKTGIIYHSYRTDTDNVFDDMLGKLGDSAFLVREQATEDMMGLGAAILARAEKAYRASDDPEVRVRLKAVIGAVTPRKAQVMSFGPYQLSQAQLALYDGEATVYVSANSIVKSGQALGAGLVVGKRDGTITVVTGSGFPQRWGSHYSEDSSPLVLESGKRVWLPRCSGGFGPGLWDLEEREFTTMMPDPRVHWLHALKTDGTIYAGRREPTQSGAGPIMRFEPKMPDDRNFLEAETIELSGGDKFCVTSDGRIWAETPDKGIVRFNGKKWEGVNGLSIRDVREFLPGNDGALIIATRNKCALITGDRVEERGSIKQLVSDCAKDITRFFKTSGYASWLSVVPDGKGHIWLRDTRKLSVLANDEWLDPKPALTAAGSRTGKVEYIGKCGDGKVYVTDFMMVHDRGSSQFGEVKDGKILFSKAPHTCERGFMSLSITDDEGGLWIPGSVRGSGGTCDWIRGQLALRIMEKETRAELKNSGWATLNDKSGNIWLGKIRSKDVNLFNIWRKGEIKHSVRVPGASARSVLIADKPGSVFVWTELGLQHMVAKDSSRPAVYSPGKLHTVRGFEGSAQNSRFSSLGYIAVAVYSDRYGARKNRLYLIKLPVGPDGHR